MQTTDTVHVAGIGDRAPRTVLDVLVESFLHDAAKRAAEDARQRRVVEDSQKENTERLGVKGGEKPDQRAEQNIATPAVGVRWSEEVEIRLGAARAGNAGRA